MCWIEKTWMNYNKCKMILTLMTNSPVSIWQIEWLKLNKKRKKRNTAKYIKFQEINMLNKLLMPALRTLSFFIYIKIVYNFVL